MLLQMLPNRGWSSTGGRRSMRAAATAAADPTLSYGVDKIFRIIDIGHERRDSILALF